MFKKKKTGTTNILHMGHVESTSNMVAAFQLSDRQRIVQFFCNFITD